MRCFHGRDGVRLAYRDVGEGRPLVLLHGYLSSSESWAAHAFPGRRVLMPDLRAHGASDRPHDPARYPRDVLADDGLAFVEQLGLTDYDLGGYSIGGRVVVRMLARGARPRRAIVAGVGIEVVDNPGRGAFYRHVFANLGTFDSGSREGQIEAWLRRSGADPVALGHVLDALEDTPREALAAIPTPTLVVIGEADNHGGADELAALLPNGVHRTVPGDHGTAMFRPELREAIEAFLGS